MGPGALLLWPSMARARSETLGVSTALKTETVPTCPPSSPGPVPCWVAVSHRTVLYTDGLSKPPVSNPRPPAPSLCLRHLISF